MTALPAELSPAPAQPRSLVRVVADMMAMVPLAESSLIMALSRCQLSAVQTPPAQMHERWAELGELLTFHLGAVPAALHGWKRRVFETFTGGPADAPAPPIEIAGVTVDELAVEVEPHLAGHPGFQLQLGFFEALTLLGHLQVICQVTPAGTTSHNFAERLGRRIQASVAVTPKLKAVCAAGWEGASQASRPRNTERSSS